MLVVVVKLLLQSLHKNLIVPLLVPFFTKCTELQWGQQLTSLLIVLFLGSVFSSFNDFKNDFLSLSDKEPNSCLIIFTHKIALYALFY